MPFPGTALRDQSDKIGVASAKPSVCSRVIWQVATNCTGYGLLNQPQASVFILLRLK